jgi:RimJ/RimL family protein N-acetyltransferase
MFEFQPELSGKLLRLRGLAVADFESLYQVASDPVIWEQHPDKARSERGGFRRFFDKAIDSGGTLLAIDRLNNAAIGCSRFHSFHEARSDVTIGYTFLARVCWGGTYNTEMKHLMLGHAFRLVQSVRFRIAEHNMRCRRAVEKLGASFLGPEDHQEFGQTHVVYAIDRKQWLQSSLR